MRSVLRKTGEASMGLTFVRILEREKSGWFDSLSQGVLLPWFTYHSEQGAHRERSKVFWNFWDQCAQWIGAGLQSCVVCFCRN